MSSQTRTIPSPVPEKPVLAVLDGTGEESAPLSSETGFPESLILFAVGGGLYGAVNATTVGPDPMEANLLAVFEEMESFEIFKTASGMEGRPERKTFEEARNIALSKPGIHGLGLQRRGSTVAIHWIR